MSCAPIRFPPAWLARRFTLGETRAEWKAFRAGFSFRVRFGLGCPPGVERNGRAPYAKAMGLYPRSQDCRVAWEVGWTWADDVARGLGPTEAHDDVHAP